jgi:hypothetical protein
MKGRPCVMGCGRPVGPRRALKSRLCGVCGGWFTRWGKRDTGDVMRYSGRIRLAASRLDSFLHRRKVTPLRRKAG